MRHAFEEVEIAGNIVIGEGERDEAPMSTSARRSVCPRPGSITRRSISPSIPSKGPTCAPWERRIRSPCSRHPSLAAPPATGLRYGEDRGRTRLPRRADIDAPVRYNLKAIAHCLDREVKDLVIMVLDRPRHSDLIRQIRTSGARIGLIPDGDLSAGIGAALRGAGVDAVMGTGGAPEGVIHGGCDALPRG